jgi:hypothetical protein
VAIIPVSACHFLASFTCVSNLPPPHVYEGLSSLDLDPADNQGSLHVNIFNMITFVKHLFLWVSPQVLMGTWVLSGLRSKPVSQATCWPFSLARLTVHFQHCLRGLSKLCLTSWTDQSQLLLSSLHLHVSATARGGSLKLKCSKFSLTASLHGGPSGLLYSQLLVTTLEYHIHAPFIHLHTYSFMK